MVEGLGSLFILVLSSFLFLLNLCISIYCSDLEVLVSTAMEDCGPVDLGTRSGAGGMAQVGRAPA
jgi:hypothetical protein